MASSVAILANKVLATVVRQTLAGNGIESVEKPLVWDHPLGADPRPTKLTRSLADAERRMVLAAYSPGLPRSAPAIQYYPTAFVLGYRPLRQRGSFIAGRCVPHHSGGHFPAGVETTLIDSNRLREHRPVRR